jgi:hypothetical protein
VEELFEGATEDEAVHALEVYLQHDGAEVVHSSHTDAILGMIGRVVVERRS